MPPPRNRWLKKPCRSLPAVAARNRRCVKTTAYRAATAGSDPFNRIWQSLQPVSVQVGQVPDLPALNFTPYAHQELPRA